MIVTTIPDLTNLQEWSNFCEKRMIVLEVLALLNARHRERVAEVIAELAQYRAAVKTLADQDFGAGGWNEQCNQAALVLRNLLKKQ